MTNAFIYSKDFCPYCVRAKAILKQRGYNIEEVDGVANREAMLADLEKETNPTKTFPQIWLDGQYIGGHDQLVAHLASM